MPSVKIFGKWYKTCCPNEPPRFKRNGPHMKRLTRIDRLLSELPKVVNQIPEQKLTYLVRKATGRRRFKNNYKNQRKKKNRPDGPCFVCSGKANYKHHIIPLCCGGTNNYKNLINICHNCHCKIHAWMIPTIPTEIRELDAAFRNTLK